MKILDKYLISFLTLIFGFGQIPSAQNSTDLDKLKTNEQLTKICDFKNPSFEKDHFTMDGHISDWNDCGLPRYTPPTIHENGKTVFNVQHKASEGKNFISMVVRDDESWELISQELSSSLSPLNEYIFKIDVAFSESMNSPTTKSIQTPASFDRPIVLRIYGGLSACDKGYTLFKSDAIKQEEWQSLDIRFKPENEIKWISIECFYDIPTLKPYNGNLLIDNLSPIYLINN